MTIDSIITYLVSDRTDTESIKGVDIPQKGKLFDIANAVYFNSDNITPLSIMFTKDSLTGQQNEMRTKIISYAKNPILASGMHIAERLKEFTTKRSKIGLLMLISGKDGTTTKCAIARFPAEEGIMAHKDKGSLKVSFVEQIFLKSAKSFKSVIYEGSNFNTDFWTGIAIDKQINDSVREVSDYWTKGFLKSDYKTKPKAGTRRFADALRQAIDATSDNAIKSELISAAVLAKNYSGKTITPHKMFLQASLSADAVSAFSKAFPNKACLSDSFIFDKEEYNSRLAFEMVETDRGALVLAPVDSFDKIVEIDTLKDGTSQISTKGVIINTGIKRLVK